MKYMLMIYNRPGYIDELSQAERDELFGDVDRIMKDLTATGEMLGGEALGGPEKTKTVRVRDGVPAVTDGPFIEAKEQFAGDIMVDCASEERAVEIAASWPDAKWFRMEVRPLITPEG